MGCIKKKYFGRAWESASTISALRGHCQRSPLPVAPEGVVQALFYAEGKVGGLQDLHGRAEAHQSIEKIGRGAQIQGEVGEGGEGERSGRIRHNRLVRLVGLISLISASRLRQFALRGVEGEVAEVGGGGAVGAQDDMDGRGVLFAHHAEAVGEIFRSAEIRRHAECAGRNGGGKNPVERIDGEGALFVLRGMAQQIPALPEELEGVGLHLAPVLRAGIADRVGVFMVNEPEAALLLHSLEDQAQGVAVGGDVLHQDAVFQGEAVAEQVGDGQAGEHPVSHGGLMQGFGVGNAVARAAGARALYQQSIGGEDGVPKAEQGGARQGASVIEVALLPQGGELRQGQAGGVGLKGVYQPYLFLYRHNEISFFKENGNCGGTFRILKQRYAYFAKRNNQKPGYYDNGIQLRHHGAGAREPEHLRAGALSVAHRPEDGL